MGNSSKKPECPEHQKTEADSEEIEEIVEEEIWVCTERSESGTHRVKLCKPLTEEEGFISVNQLVLDKLPEPIRDEAVLRYIRISEKLVVNLFVSEGSKARKEAFVGGGTGCVWLCSDKVEEYDTCPLRDCTFNNGQPHKGYGGLLVYTNHHVVIDDFEARKCQVRFFYDFDVEPASLRNGRKSDQNTDDDVDDGKVCRNNDDSASNENKHLEEIMAYGLCLRENKENKDLVGLKIVYHEKELFDLIYKFSGERLPAWNAIPNKLKIEMKKHAVVISHPEGFAKKVSFGDLLCKEEPDKVGRKVTKYNAATRRGSSGAPVLTGYYVSRPFTHSTKIKRKLKNSSKVLSVVNIAFSY